MNKDPYVIYVTIGLPGSNIPIVEKAGIYVDHAGGETPVQAAKLLRKRISDSPFDYGFTRDTKFKPSQLYYEVYITVYNEAPYACSLNAKYLEGFKKNGTAISSTTNW